MCIKSSVVTVAHKDSKGSLQDDCNFMKLFNENLPPGKKSVGKVMESK